MEKVLIAMSGGVDSSVAAFLMKEQGCQCIGATMKLFHNEDIGVKATKTCCSLEDVEDARLVEDEVHVPVLEHRDCRRLLTLVVAHARGRAQLARWDVVGDPVEVICRQLTRKKRVVAA